MAGMIVNPAPAKRRKKKKDGPKAAVAVKVKAPSAESALKILGRLGPKTNASGGRAK